MSRLSSLHLLSVESPVQTWRAYLDLWLSAPLDHLSTEQGKPVHRRVILFQSKIIILEPVTRRCGQAKIIGSLCYMDPRC